MAVNVYEVGRVSCQPHTLLTSDANDFVNALKAMQERNLCSRVTGYPRINEHVLLCVLVTGEVKRIGHFG